MRRKRLIDAVRDASFIARKDEHLLAQRDPLPWPALEELRLDYLAAPLDCGDRKHGECDKRCRRAIGLSLEHGLRADGPELYVGTLAEAMASLPGKVGSFKHLAAFAERYFRHFAGPRAGESFRFDPYQAAFLTEFMRRRPDGRRVYSVGLLILPKGNGKTPLAAVLGTYALCTSTDSAAEVYNVAGSRDQAAICFDFARRNIETSELLAWLDFSRGTIRSVSDHGEYEILSSDGNLAAGVQPTAAVLDEIYQYRHQAERELYAQLVGGLPKRAGQAFALSITTPGWTKDSLLGEMYDAAIAHPEIEHREDGFLRVLRDEESGFLAWMYGVPEGMDVPLDDISVLDRVNPAPWLDSDDLLAQLRQPGADENDWRRLHRAEWTLAKSSWISSGIWARLKSETQIPEGAEILVGIDAARTFDTTSVAWQWISPEGRKVQRAHVWSVRRNVPHHTFVDGGELVNEELIEPFVHELNQRYKVRAIALDPRYLNAEAKHLSDAGFEVIKVEPHSKIMGDAVVQQEKDVLSAVVEHDGDRVVQLHMDAVEVRRADDGAKKIGKRAEGVPIDAAIASILANSLALVELPGPSGWRPM